VNHDNQPKIPSRAGEGRECPYRSRLVDEIVSRLSEPKTDTRDVGRVHGAPRQQVEPKPILSPRGSALSIYRARQGVEGTPRENPAEGVQASLAEIGHGMREGGEYVDGEDSEERELLRDVLSGACSSGDDAT
jgi:hypothetical protein